MRHLETRTEWAAQEACWNQAQKHCIGGVEEQAGRAPGGSLGQRLVPCADSVSSNSDREVSYGQTARKHGSRGRGSGLTTHWLCAPRQVTPFLQASYSSHL